MKRLVIAKLPASSSGLLQPCDLGECFKQLKIMMKALEREAEQAKVAAARVVRKARQEAVVGGEGQGGDEGEDGDEGGDGTEGAILQADQHQQQQQQGAGDDAEQVGGIPPTEIVTPFSFESVVVFRMFLREKGIKLRYAGHWYVNHTDHIHTLISFTHTHTIIVLYTVFFPYDYSTSYDFSIVPLRYREQLRITNNLFLI